MDNQNIIYKAWRFLHG